MEWSAIKFKDEDEMQPDWSRWENHVLTELKRLNGNIEKAINDQASLTTKYYDLVTEIAIIKTRIAAYAAAFGFFGSLLVPAGQFIWNMITQTH